jgi:hypothetical protein
LEKSCQPSSSRKNSFSSFRFELKNRNIPPLAGKNCPGDCRR